RDNIWDDQELARFVADLREVDPAVTGTPVQNHEASGQLRDSYLSAAGYALLAIVLILLVDVCRLETMLKAWSTGGVVLLLFAALQHSSGIELTQWRTVAGQLSLFTVSVLLASLVLERKDCAIGLLALLPPALGMGTLLGTMALLGQSFTPANLIALPLVLGIGIDDGVHVIHDFRRQTARYLMSSSTFRALVLTSLTSMVGFGSLAFASHRGLSGLGQVVTVGITSCMLVSVTVLPALLSLASAHRIPSEVAEESEEKFAAETSVKLAA
ncbi:MAG: MMPL family transporter, partial [Planctomycetaceae bacterium]|nr:MMPL family transporter [Planctomycetaceae bacterium]